MLSPPGTTFSNSARAGNHRFSRSSARRAITKPPYKNDLLWKTLRALNRPGMARTLGDPADVVGHQAFEDNGGVITTRTAHSDAL
jgi:hypothetical protein